MHISTQGFTATSSLEAVLSRRKRSSLPSEGVVLVWIVLVCTVLAVVDLAITMRFDPDLFQMVVG